MVLPCLVDFHKGEIRYYFPKTLISFFMISNGSCLSFPAYEYLYQFLFHSFFFISFLSPFFFFLSLFFLERYRSPSCEISRGGNYVYFTRHSVPSYFSFSPTDFHIFLFPILSPAHFFVSRCPQTNMLSEVFSILTFCFRLDRQSVSVRLENV